MTGKVLIAIDIHEQDIAQPALDAGLELARSADAEIRLVHVRAPVPAAAMDYVPVNMAAEQEKYSLEQLKGLAGKLPYDARKVSVASRSGPVYASVLEEAKEWKADTIVVSAHQPTAATYLLGSNATKIVRHAPCSVMVARSSKKASLFA